MFRKIIKIDEGRCNGCGACANACHEGAIEMVIKSSLGTLSDLYLPL
jgi:ferredoxin